MKSQMILLILAIIARMIAYGEVIDLTKGPTRPHGSTTDVLKQSEKCWRSFEEKVLTYWLPVKSWYYDYLTGRCVEHNGVNKYSFGSRQLCEKYCSRQVVCRKYKGIRRSCAPNVIRWRYDTETDDCEQFIYGGCREGANVFESLSACRQKCQMELSHKTEIKCVAYGDPHFKQFDGDLFDYQGTCWYTMVRDNCVKTNGVYQEPRFRVIARFWTRGGTFPGPSWVKEVKIFIDSVEVLLGQQKKVTLNGESITPPYFHEMDIVIALYGDYVTLYHIRTNLEVRYDGYSILEIFLPPKFSGKVCGFCGNYNGKEDEGDLQLGPNCEGQITDNYEIFGSSWADSEYAQTNPECVDCSGIPRIPDTCETIPERNRATAECSKVFVEPCLSELTAAQQKYYIESCIYDYCASPETLCDSLRLFLDICIDNGVHMSVPDSLGYCKPSCDSNEVYLDCGRRSDDTTCFEVLSGSVFYDPEESCVSGCFCKPLFYRNENHDCVPYEECGCVDGQRKLKKGCVWKKKYQGFPPYYMIYLPRWTFDLESKKCTQSISGGQRGTANTFGSYKACFKKCGILTLLPVQLCLMPIDSGDCSSSEYSWYYDSVSGTCRTFNYSGCGGNGNQFKSKGLCENTCSREVICREDVGNGTQCQLNSNRWKFHPDTGQCRQFVDGTCEGETTSFKSKEACESKCTRPTEIEICGMSNNVGDCDGSMTAWRCVRRLVTKKLSAINISTKGPFGQINFPQWTYNPDNDLCEEFLYALGPHPNHFLTLEACERKCRPILPVEECDCPSDSICHEKPDGTHVCQCLLGFTGDCGLCVDIDECATGMDNCSRHSICTNTVGSFSCRCKDGFVLRENMCVDVDECKDKKDNCSDHSACVNTYGSFMCICCNGYEDDGRGICVATGKLYTTGHECCVCRGKHCDEEGEICGEDGQTYNDMKHMIITECEEGRNIRLDYHGKCQDSCDGVQCPRYQTCIVQGQHATCVCEECELSEENEDPVCSTGGDLYDNMCQFYTAMCKYDLEQDISPDNSECDDSDTAEWSEWSLCSVTCGKGGKTRTRSSQSVTADCYEDPCPGGPCDGYDCGNEAMECFINHEGNAECECPSCEGVGTDAVCGFIEDKTQTFSNLCRFQRRACRLNGTFELVSQGPCAEKSLNCERVLSFAKVYNDDECVTKRKKILHHCDGSCGVTTDDCCEPVETKNVTFTVWCAWGTSETLNVEDVLDCQCRSTMP
ncbi:hypothetical protein ScPMuIL_004360 [Solemya velum]